MRGKEDRNETYPITVQARLVNNSTVWIPYNLHTGTEYGIFGSSLDAHIKAKELKKELVESFK